MEDKQVIVSDEFIEIYKNFNVVDQTEEMKNLSRKELYYLLICCIDRHDEDGAAIENFKPFEAEINEILEFQESEATKVAELLQLQEDTGKYIPTSKTISIKGEELPTPYTKEEARELKIDSVFKNKNLK